MYTKNGLRYIYIVRLVTFSILKFDLYQHFTPLESTYANYIYKKNILIYAISTQISNQGK